MNGLKILMILAAICTASVIYLKMPSNEDLERRDGQIDKHREVINAALADCTVLVKDLSSFKYTEQKKVEMKALRSRFSDLEEKAAGFLEDEAMDRQDRRIGLDQLENEYWDLLRDSEDLRARMREMKLFVADRVQMMAYHGRMRKELAKAQALSTDLDFQRRANSLIDRSKSLINMLDQALMRLGISIGEGRALGGAALTELTEINSGMAELVRETGGEPPAPPPSTKAKPPASN